MQLLNLLSTWIRAEQTHVYRLAFIPHAGSDMFDRREQNCLKKKKKKSLTRALLTLCFCAESTEPLYSSCLMAVDNSVFDPTWDERRA